ncbi:uncharacterized protein LOC141806159 isoform X2 [Halichoeres trimaculatus]|uniref:uncharacterized protein LOC141806159 isoform X2 n=1 Tax=Halichoeres trimaculatus TaxID=147232 RepID=UPI003D9FA566
MATGDKKRSTFITGLELDVLMQAYREYEHIFNNKSNTTAASKEREAAWQKIAARVNERNLGGEKRTWKQLKMKYKNLASANRRRAKSLKTGGDPTPPDEMDKSQSPGPALLDEGVPGGGSCETVTPQDTSAFIKCSDSILCFVKPHSPAADEEDNKDGIRTLILSTVTGGNPESSDEKQQETEAPSTSTAQLPMQELNRMYLIKKMTKMDKEMVFLDRQIQKTDLEIEMLQHQLEEIKRTK